MEENKRHEDLAGKIELAVNENRDDLAEAAIARQLDIEAQIPVLKATISDCDDQEKELENYLNALMAKRREMNEELIQFRQTAKAAGDQVSSDSPAGSNADSVESRVSKAESAFDRVIERATGLPGQAGTSSRKTAAQLAELEELARKNKIRERLAQLKGGAKSS
jgi:phage shock protein A